LKFSSDFFNVSILFKRPLISVTNLISSSLKSLTSFSITCLLCSNRFNSFNDFSIFKPNKQITTEIIIAVKAIKVNVKKYYSADSLAAAS